jgi:hypothetical protein
MLPHQAFYQTYVRQLSALALVPGVCLKLLPPTIINSAGAGAGWWADEDELLRCAASLACHRSQCGLKAPTTADLSSSIASSVLKHFIIPALDSFGSHRLMFGSSSVPLALTTGSSETLVPAVPDAQRAWYPLVLRLMRSLKLDRESVGEIMAGSAGRVYGLEQSWRG